VRRQWNFGAVVTSDWKRGFAAYEGNGGGTLIFEGEVLEIDPPTAAGDSLTALWGEDVKSEGTSRRDLGDFASARIRAGWW